MMMRIHKTRDDEWPGCVDNFSIRIFSYESDGAIGDIAYAAVLDQERKAPAAVDCIAGEDNSVRDYERGIHF